jgi:hypothetical protein
VIVDFEQDPSAPFGSGNFRDDAGRITYLHDPETASDFVPTMSGSMSRGGGGGKPVGDPPEPVSAASPGASLVQQQSDAVARLAGGPSARAAAPAPVPTAPALAPIPAPAAATPEHLSPEEAAKLGTDIDAAGAPSPGAPPGAPPAAPPGAPAPAAAATGTGPGADLVRTNDEHVNTIHGPTPAAEDPRLRAPGAERLPYRNTLDLPAASVSDSETLSTDEGRPIENALADDRDITAAQDAGDEQALAAARAADKQADAAYRGQQGFSQRQYGQNVARFYESKRLMQEAESEQQRLQAALKENDEKLDPDRYMRNMSGGKRIGMVILAALNGGFGALIDKKNNDVVDIMQREIDADIDKQKQEIANGHASINNQIAKWQQKGFKAEDAEALARDHADGAMNAILETEIKRTGTAGANERAVRIAFAPKLEERAIKRAALFKEVETKKHRALEARTIHAVPLPGAPGQPGALGTPGMAGVPKIAPVGTEDKDQATRERFANAYNPSDPAERGQMTALSKELDVTSKLKQTLARLEKAYDVSVDAKGQYPAHGKKIGDTTVDYSSRATGPMWNPENALPNDSRDRDLADAWAEVETNTRNYWESEPNGEVKQKELSGIDRPKRDEDGAKKLADIRQEIARRELAAQSGTNATVRGAYKLQNGYPLLPARAPAPAKPGASGKSQKEKATEAADKAGGETIAPAAPLPTTLDGKPKRPGGAEAY